jgi:hypothetical protein
MKEVGSFETLLARDKTTWGHISKDCNLEMIVYGNLFVREIS